MDLTTKSTSFTPALDAGARIIMMSVTVVYLSRTDASSSAPVAIIRHAEQAAGDGANSCEAKIGVWMYHGRLFLFLQAGVYVHVYCCSQFII